MRWYLVAAALAVLPAGLALAQAPEVRGLWMQTAGYNTPEKAEAAVARAAAAHLNALYPLVWCSGGQAWFRTDLSPLASTLPAGYDPLGYLVKAAHARGIQVHPWFINGSSGRDEPGVLLTQHPDWALQGTLRGRQPWYDLGKPEVREFETALMIDCLRRYDIDGLHFDYIRYGSQQYCYCDHCQREFASRSGLPPLVRDDAHFPVRLTLVGNPLTEPTTAETLATFEDGTPAITLNRLGKGEAALLNWQTPRYYSEALNEAALCLLRRLGATPDGLFLLSTTTTLRAYGSESQSRATSWLGDRGYKPQRVSEKDLARIPAEGTVVLYAQYELGEQTAAWLRRFVSEGGHCLFIDGPTRAIRLPALREVVGFRSFGPLFNRLRLVVPTPGQTVLPTCPPVDLARERTRTRKWVEYREWTVTQLVRSVYGQAKALKPRAQISAAVFPSREEADAICQDWYRWLREGIIDYAIPMTYVLDNGALQAALEEWRGADPTMERIIPGLGLWMSRDGKDVSRPRDKVLSQVELCRKYGARGELFFAYASLNEDLADALATGPYREVVAPYVPAPPKRK